MSNDSKIHFKIASTVNLSRQPCDSYVERLNGRQRAKGNDLGIQENNLRLMSKSDSAPEQRLQYIKAKISKHGSKSTKDLTVRITAAPGIPGIS